MFGVTICQYVLSQHSGTFVTLKSIISSYIVQETYTELVWLEVNRIKGCGMIHWYEALC